MKILFTGSSSFTGFWFIQELAKNGHTVIATFQNSLGNYSGIRKERILQLQKLCQCQFECPFGTSPFLQLINDKGPWDLLCHHAAHVTNYKSPDFDVVAALQQNTFNALPVLKELQNKECNKVLLTGSIFEQDEGAGSQRAFSPYGLSKGLTHQHFRYYTESLGMKLGKFVIPNPFGPYEEPRFTSYLINSWKEGKTPKVATPAYVRDNIHVDLLAKGYATFAGSLSKAPGQEFLRPSGYPESQGAFTQRFATEMAKRLPFACPFELQEQSDFPEPRVRINTDLLTSKDYAWHEKSAWDSLATYYLTQT